MALHPDLPISPYEPLRAEHDDLRDTRSFRTEPRPGGPGHRFVCVDEDGFRGHRPAPFQGLVETFREHRG